MTDENIKLRAYSNWLSSYREILRSRNEFDKAKVVLTAKREFEKRFLE